MTKRLFRYSVIVLALLGGIRTLFVLPLQAGERNYPYAELEGTVEEHRYIREWRAYYWRDDNTMIVRDDTGKRHRVISREPTPWNNLRLGTTYTGLKVDWTKNPRVKIIGVKAVDRQPEEFYDLKLDPANTITAFIVRVQTEKDGRWRDYYVNNWFHDWSPDTDVKMLSHYANNDPNYTVYGYLKGIKAPFDAEGQQLIDKHSKEWGGIIYHGRVVKAENEVGYAVRLLHLMGRNKKSLEYKVFHGDGTQIPKLEQQKPSQGK